MGWADIGATGSAARAESRFRQQRLSVSPPRAEHGRSDPLTRRRPPDMSVHTAERKADSRGLPLGVYLLAFSLFAMGSAEFLVAGVLPQVADDLRISLSSAGALISAFAIGVVIGGPPLAVITLHWPRRTTLVVTQVLFAASLALGLLVDNYALLL